MIGDPKVLPAFLLACCTFANAVSSTNREVSGSPDAVAEMSAQLAVGEFNDVATKAERLAAELESHSGRYDPELVKPLTLLGDARMGMDDPNGALEAYDRAKHILRISEGVQALGQLHLLYREADALVSLGDREAANGRHEFAYRLQLRTYGEDDPRLVPGMYRLIHWYRHNYKFRASQVLYERIIDIARDRYPAGDPRTIEVLQDYVGTYRERRFGRRQPGRGGFSAWPPGHPKDPPWHQTSSFRKGRQALREVLELTEATPGVSDATIAAALLELADWHLLYYEYGIAMGFYRRVWALLESDARALAEAFERPTPLYLPLPVDPARRSARRGTPLDGVVTLALTVTHRGDVVGRKTLRAEPQHNLMEFKVRKAAKRARYRPAFQSANPVPRRGLELEYKYQYFPGDIGPY